MGSFYIIVPHATRNLIKNPSFEVNANGWTASDPGNPDGIDEERYTVLFTSSGKSRRGGSALRVTPSSDLYGGAAYNQYGMKGPIIALEQGAEYTLSLDFFGTAGLPYRLRIYNGLTASSFVNFVADGTWQRIVLTFVAEVSMSEWRVVVMKRNSDNVEPFYIDGVQLEQLGYMTTYVDGDINGARWTGVPYASFSERSNIDRSGGRIVDFDTVNAYLTSQQGTGMPPMRTITAKRGAGGGAYLIAQFAESRNMTLNLSQSGDGIIDFHAKRQALINLIRPMSHNPSQPFILGYRDNREDVRIRCIYESGMEINGLSRDIEAISLNLVAHEPYWYEVQESSFEVQASYDQSGSIARLYSTGQREVINGSSYGSSVQTPVFSAENIFYFSVRTTLNGTSTWHVREQNGFNAQQLGTYFFDDTITNIHVTQQNRVFCIGRFRGFSGTSIRLSGIAGWTGTQWTSTGANLFAVIVGAGNAPASVWNITSSVDGAIYISGLIRSQQTTSSGTRIPAEPLVSWDGITYYPGTAFPVWKSYGTESILRYPNGDIMPAGSISVDVDKSMYITVGGMYLQDGIQQYRTGELYYYNGTTWVSLCKAWNYVGEVRHPGAILRTRISNEGLLYIGGAFTHLELASGVIEQHRNVAIWDGYAFIQAGDGLTYPVQTLTEDPSSGFIYATQDDPAGGDAYLSLPQDIPRVRPTDFIWEYPAHCAFWNGSSWLPMANIVGRIIPTFSQYDDHVLSTIQGFAGYPNEVVNRGTADAYPRIIIRGHAWAPHQGARVLHIVNWTTRTYIYLDMSVYRNERVVINFKPGERSITSSMNTGKSLGACVLPGSSFSDFRLVPGINIITVLHANTMTTPGALNIYLEWQNTHWSIDGSSV